MNTRNAYNSRNTIILLLLIGGVILLAMLMSPSKPEKWEYTRLVNEIVSEEGQVKAVYIDNDVAKILFKDSETKNFPKNHDAKVNIVSRDRFLEELRANGVEHGDPRMPLIEFSDREAGAAIWNVVFLAAGALLFVGFIFMMFRQTPTHLTALPTSIKSTSSPKKHCAGL